MPAPLFSLQNPNWVPPTASSPHKPPSTAPSNSTAPIPTFLDPLLLHATTRASLLTLDTKIAQLNSLAASLSTLQKEAEEKQKSETKKIVNEAVGKVGKELNVLQAVVAGLGREKREKQGKEVQVLVKRVEELEGVVGEVDGRVKGVEKRKREDDDGREELVELKREFKALKDSVSGMTESFEGELAKNTDMVYGVSGDLESMVFALERRIEVMEAEVNKPEVEPTKINTETGHNEARQTDFNANLDTTRFPAESRKLVTPPVQMVTVTTKRRRKLVYRDNSQAPLASAARPPVANAAVNRRLDSDEL